MPDFNIFLHKKLILFNEFYWYSQICSYRGCYFIYSTIIISHYCHYVIISVLLFILKRMYKVCRINNSAEYMTICLVVVKLDINFKRYYVALRVFNIEILLSLYKCGISSLPELFKKWIVILRYKLRHKYVNGLCWWLKLIWGVTQHLTKLPVRIDDLAKFRKGTFDQEKTWLIHIGVELILVGIFIELIIHTINLLHF